MHKRWGFFLFIITHFICQNIYPQPKELIWDDTTRTYVVVEPATLEENINGYPLIIGLHGTGSNGLGFIATAFLAQKAAKEQFIAACPDALNHNLFTYFNAGDGYEELTNDTDDVGFITALIDTMIFNYNIDTTRIYIMGFSNGSMMAYRMAVALSEKIAAIATGSGQMVYEYYNPEFPVPIIHVHGLNDNLVPYEGKGDSILVVPHVDSVLVKWQVINDCNLNADTIYSDESGIIGKKWASSDGRTDIVLYTIPGMEHQWSYTSSFGISSTDIMWDFLKHQERQNTTVVDFNAFNSNSLTFNLYQNYPNPFNPSTKIKYRIIKPGYVVLKVYNLAGQEITTLIHDFQKAGNYEIIWHPRGIPSGLYFYHLKYGNHSVTRKMIFQK